MGSAIGVLYCFGRTSICYATIGCIGGLENKSAFAGLLRLQTLGPRLYIPQASKGDLNNSTFMKYYFGNGRGGSRLLGLMVSCPAHAPTLVTFHALPLAMRAATDLFNLGGQREMTLIDHRSIDLYRILQTLTLRCRQLHNCEALNQLRNILTLILVAAILS